MVEREVGAIAVVQGYPMTILARDTERHVSVEDAQLGDVLSRRGENRIERLRVRIIAIEFLAVAGTCFLTSWLYFAMVLTAQPPVQEYAVAALIIATLVVLVALGYKQYAAIQSPSRDRYLWSAIGAITLAFSLFLSLLFLFKIADWYSRGTFFFQFLAVSAAMLIARGSAHEYVRRAIQSGAVQARKAIVVGDSEGNRYVLERLRQFGIHWVGILPFHHVRGNAVPSTETFLTDIRTFVERCRGLKLDDIFFLAGPRRELLI